MNLFTGFGVGLGVGRGVGLGVGALVGVTQLRSVTTKQQQLQIITDTSKMFYHPISPDGKKHKLLLLLNFIFYNIA